MKKFNLLKKLTAVFVIVAIGLSFGTIAFAANPGEYVGDRSIQITDIYCKPSETVTGLYKVTVKCEVAEDAMDKNAIGVTMLTYAKKNKSLNVSSSNYDKYDETDDTMQIVGIDQQQRGNGVKEVEFVFTVTTIDADTNAYAVQPGKAAVVLVSGDGLSPAAGLFKIPNEKIAATATAVYDGTVDVYSYDTNETVREKLKENFETTTATVVDAEDNVLGTVDIEAEYIKSIAINEGVYTVTAVIPVDATVNSEDYDVTIPAAGLTLTFDVVANAVPWEADTVTPKFETAQTIIINDIVGEEDIIGLFLGKTVEVSASAVAAAKATVTITDEMIAAAETNPTEFAVDGVFNYTITIPDTADYTVAADVNTIEVSATIDEAPSHPFDIVTVEIAGDYGRSYTDEEGATKDDIVAEVILDLQNNTGLTATVKGANDNEIETWYINETTWAYDADKDVFTAEIVKPIEEMLGVNASNLKVEIADIVITVVAPPYVLGDVNNDGNITMSDAIRVVRMLLPATHSNYYAATDAERLAANVNGDLENDGGPKVTMSDAILIVRRILPANHINAITKFPAEENN